ncbi:MAG: patatin-like phospholipase family protein [Clostridiales bacterium]|nr:patatin-like phospholipase family protein [Clostridiales bacterium]
MYGLVLEGGGGKGSYQVGAFKALNELGLEVGAVAGTSVGALNGAMYVQGDSEKAYELWYNVDPSSIFNLSKDELDAFSSIGKNQGLNRAALNSVFKRARKIVSEKGLDVQPLINLVKETLDEDRIRKSPVEFGIVTVDLTGRKAVEIFKEEIPQGKLVDYIIASASFPAFKPAVIDGKTYIDGAFYNNLPIDLVNRKGFKDIIVIRTFGIGMKKKVDTSNLNIINIEPYDSLGPTLDFSRDRARSNMQMGYFDVLRSFRKLKGWRYYVEPMNDDAFFINYLAGMEEWKVSRLCELFGLENCNGKRVLFEHLVPKTADLLGLSSNYTYEDIAIGLMEKAADRISGKAAGIPGSGSAGSLGGIPGSGSAGGLTGGNGENTFGKVGLERFRIYTFNEFFDSLLKHYVYYNDDFIKEIPMFLRNKELISRLTRDRIISSIANLIFGAGS